MQLPLISICLSIFFTCLFSQLSFCLSLLLCVKVQEVLKIHFLYLVIYLPVINLYLSIFLSAFFRRVIVLFFSIVLCQGARFQSPFISIYLSMHLSIYASIYLSIYIFLPLILAFIMLSFCLSSMFCVKGQGFKIHSGLGAVFVSRRSLVQKSGILPYNSTLTVTGFCVS